MYAWIALPYLTAGWIFTRLTFDLFFPPIQSTSTEEENEENFVRGLAILIWPLFFVGGAVYVIYANAMPAFRYLASTTRRPRG